jgi:Ca-activated chloride channel family protein
VSAEKVSGGNEVMTIKFRYKEPAGTQSKLITEILYDKKVPFNQAGEDFRFITAVSEFGMLLRDSEYKGQSDFKSVLSIAKASKGEDDDGYRSEFIRLVEMAEMMKK